jgi:hypothetical protein
LGILQPEHASKVQNDDVCIRDQTFGPFATGLFAKRKKCNSTRAVKSRAVAEKEEKFVSLGA